jgi:predicted  nucleic acid-binding Zn-ribbon protein
MEERVKADPRDLLALLELQRLDLSIASLKHQRDTLAQAVRAKEAAAAAAVARDTAVARRMDADDAERDVAKHDGEVDKVRARIARDEALLASGSVSSAKQLTDLQHEVASLHRRQADLEEAELEAMERLEALRAAQAQAEAERDRAAQLAKDAVAERDAAMAELAAQYRITSTQRQAAAAAIPQPLLDRYAKLAGDLGGVAVAEFTNNQCGVCRLQMIPAELAAVRLAPVDEIIRCEECRRILVRTDLLVG